MSDQDDYDYKAEQAKAEYADENELHPNCNPHPYAPHGFDRNGSLNEDRYVCDCEHWVPDGSVVSDDPQDVNQSDSSSLRYRIAAAIDRHRNLKADDPRVFLNQRCACGLVLSGIDLPTMSDLRDRIAAALYRSDHRKDGDWDTANDTYRKLYLAGADAVIAELGLSVTSGVIVGCLHEADDE